MLRLAVSCPTASSDGKFYGRYPSGNAPIQPITGNASDISAGAAALSTAIRLAVSASSISAAGATLAGTTLTITNSSLSAATIGSAYSGQLTASGGSGNSANYVFWRDSMYPHRQLWHTCSPSGALGGTPQSAPLSGAETVTYGVLDKSTGATAFATFSISVGASGSLAFVTGATLPTAYVGGFYAFQILASGGSPEYLMLQTGLSQPWCMMPNGWVYGAPTGLGNQSFTVSLTDTYTKTTVTQTFTIPVSASAFVIDAVDPNSGQVNVPPARVGAIFRWTPNTYGGTQSGQSFTLAGTMPPGMSFNSSTGGISGTPTKPGTYTWSVVATDSGSNTTPSATFCMTIRQASTASRPSYNTGTGFFVANGVLYGSDGNEVRLRGLNRAHQDAATWAGPANGALTGANCVRTDLSYAGEFTPTQMQSALTSQYTANKIICIAGKFTTLAAFTGSISGTTLTVTAVNTTISVANGGLICLGMALAGAASGGTILSQLTSTAAGGALGLTGTYQLDSTQSGSGSMTGAIYNTTGTTDPNVIVSATNFFVYVLGQGFTPDIINIANEWGTAANWQSTYETAVSALRTAGFTGPILIDAPDYGLDAGSIVNHAAAIQAADPQQNCIFSFHAYGDAVQNNTCKISTVGPNGFGNTNVMLSTDSSVTSHPLGSSGQTSMYINGVVGITGLNGIRTCGTGYNPIFGSPGAWGVCIDGTFSGSYVSGGLITGATLAGDSAHYEVVFSALAALRSSNVCCFVGEYGPPSPFVPYQYTYVTTQDIVASGDAWQLGEEDWAWDDAGSWGQGFGMAIGGGNKGQYASVSDLTPEGLDRVKNPRTGLEHFGTAAASYG
jgi:hypothetical protein